MEFQSSFKGEFAAINFPVNIKKLTLSKIGLPWKNMSIIGTLPNLENLKLVSDAFEGRRWKANDDEFKKLKFLQLDSLKLIQWNASSDDFPRLRRLVVRNCYYLEEIPSDLGYIPTLEMIKVHSCGNSVNGSARRIQEEQLEIGNLDLKVIVSGSYW
ncbi:NB-ARC domain-containing protein [Abeliophyllum distichum]|uniref:NB-ARC domain-containing protein n=1 Tax=Abeliophyllum distichum TaxID=126358 RepID=A0ABD1V2V4_9LAMI